MLIFFFLLFRFAHDKHALLDLETIDDDLDQIGETIYCFLLFLVTLCYPLLPFINACYLLPHFVTTTFCYILFLFVTYCYFLLPFVIFCYLLLLIFYFSRCSYGSIRRSKWWICWQVWSGCCAMPSFISREKTKSFQRTNFRWKRSYQMV